MPCSSVSIVNFGQVNAGWGRSASSTNPFFANVPIYFYFEEHLFYKGLKSLWLRYNYIRKRFAFQNLVLSLEFVIQINLEHDIIVAFIFSFCSTLGSIEKNRGIYMKRLKWTALHFLCMVLS